MNAETFGIPFRQNRNRGGFRGRGAMGFRGHGRGRGASRGAFGAPHAGGSGFRGGYRGSQGGREFSSFEYRVIYMLLIWSQSLSYKMFPECRVLRNMKLNNPSYHTKFECFIWHVFILLSILGVGLILCLFCALPRRTTK